VKEASMAKKKIRKVKSISTEKIHKNIQDKKGANLKQNFSFRLPVKLKEEFYKTAQAKNAKPTDLIIEFMEFYVDPKND
jgi:hypothetical protein